MSRFIPNSNRSAFSDRQLLEEYQKYLSSDTSIEEIAGRDLSLGYEFGNELSLYNRYINLSYRMDRLFNKAASIGGFNASLQEQIDGHKRNTAQQVGKLDAYLAAIDLASDLSIDLSSILVESYADSQLEEIPTNINFDKKTGLNLTGKEAYVDAAVNAAVINYDLNDPDNVYFINRGQVVHGTWTTASDREVLFDNKSKRNLISNFYKDDSTYYHHGIFLESRNHDPMPNETFVSFFVDIGGLRKTNYFSIQVGEAKRVQLWNLQYRANTGWNNLVVNGTALAGSLVGVPGKMAVTFNDINARAFQVTLRLTNYRDIELSTVDNDGTLLNQSSPSIRRYLETIDGLSYRGDVLHVGRYFEVSVNNVKIGYRESKDVGVAGHKLELDTLPRQLYLYQDHSGLVDNYVIIDYKTAGSSRKTVKFPIPRVTDSLMTELVYPKDGIFETSFLPDLAELISVLDLGDTYSGTLEFSTDGETWNADPTLLSRTYRDPEVLYVRLGAWNPSHIYTIQYTIAAADDIYLDAERKVLLGPSNSVLVNETGYDSATIYVQSIIRTDYISRSYIESSNLIVQTV